LNKRILYLQIFSDHTPVIIRIPCTKLLIPSLLEKILFLLRCLGFNYSFKLADPGHESYPARLRQLAHGNWDVHDFGVNGATVLKKGDIPITAQKAYQRAIRSEPDVVVVILETNDAKNTNWQYIDEFVGDYTALIKKLQGLPSKPHVIACTVPPVFADHPNGMNVQNEEKINILGVCRIHKVFKIKSYEHKFKICLTSNHYHFVL